jgi:hypothetical protein
VLFDTWPVARRVLVVAALAASTALLAVAVIALTGQGTTRPSASSADVYTRLAQQLKGHLAPLVPANTTTKKHAPTIQVPQTQGYSCEIASGTGCSLHPCVKYAQSVGAVAVAATATAGRCKGTARAAPHAVPIVAQAAPVAP